MSTVYTNESRRDIQGVDNYKEKILALYEDLCAAYGTVRPPYRFSPFPCLLGMTLNFKYAKKMM